VGYLLVFVVVGAIVMARRTKRRLFA